MGMRIIRPGLLSTIQDCGRPGYTDSGFPVSGAVDKTAMRIANILVGNDRDSAVIEMTMQGLEAVFTSPAIIAVTGADMDAKLNGNPLPRYKAVKVETGDIIDISFATSGLRGYFALSGGFYLKKALGSNSTNIKAGIGGYMGRALKANDLLFFNTVTPGLADLGKRRIDPPAIPSGSVTVRVIMGPQDDYFTEKGIATFLGGEYKVTNDSDRMGLKLSGEPIESKRGVDIISDGIPEGGIQIPSSGMPIIMMSDRQTTGGYAKIATVISSDMPLLAQLRPGDTIKFNKITVKEAHRIYKKQLRTLNKLEKTWKR